MGEWNGMGSWPSLEALALFEWAGVAVDGVCVCGPEKSIRASETWQLAAMRLTAPISSRQRVINTKTTPAGVALRPFYFNK